MKKVSFEILACFLLLVVCLHAQVGARIGDSQLADTSGKAYRLDSRPANVVVLVFWSFKCPVALIYDSRLNELQQKYGAKGVTILGVDSSPNESPEEVRLNAVNLKLVFPVLMDDEGTLAERLRIVHVPSAVVLDRGFVVRYVGPVDNNKKAGESGRIPYLEEAIEAILAGRPVSAPEVKTFGCSLRRKS